MNLKFRYTNWRGDDHEYVIIPEDISCFDPSGEEGTHWYISGLLVTRDGDSRPDMGTRRRSFKVIKMRDIEEVL